MQTDATHIGLTRAWQSPTVCHDTNRKALLFHEDLSDNELRKAQQLAADGRRKRDLCAECCAITLLARYPTEPEKRARS